MPARSTRRQPRCRRATEAALHQPPLEDRLEALRLGVSLDDAMDHAVKVAPLAATLRRERTVEQARAQARPVRLAGRQHLQAVPVLQVGGHHGCGERRAVRVDDRDALGVPSPSPRVIAPRPPHGQTRHGLRVDNDEGRGPDATSRRRRATYRTASSNNPMAVQRRNQP